MNEQESVKMIEYLQWHKRMQDLSNEDLIKELLKVAPVFGALGELIEIAVERLSPGILEKLAAQRVVSQTDPEVNRG